MKILIDVSLSPQWVPFLLKHGLEAVHWSTVGQNSAPDYEILNHAERHGFVVFTHDLDFGMILAVRKSRGPSVIQIRDQDVLPATIGAAVVRAIETARSHLDSGALVTIDSERQRIRMLPL